MLYISTWFLLLKAVVSGPKELNEKHITGLHT